jgi:hypothetical protein
MLDRDASSVSGGRLCAQCIGKDTECPTELQHKQMTRLKMLVADEVALSWNSLYSSLIRMARKLEKLGSVHYYGAVHSFDIEGDDHI